MRAAPQNGDHHQQSNQNSPNKEHSSYFRNLNRTGQSLQPTNDRVCTIIKFFFETHTYQHCILIDCFQNKMVSPPLFSPPYFNLSPPSLFFTSLVDPPQQRAVARSTTRARREGCAERGRGRDSETLRRRAVLSSVPAVHVRPLRGVRERVAIDGCRGWVWRVVVVVKMLFGV